MSENGDFEAVRKDIAKLMHQPEYDDGSAGPVLVRLAWWVPLLYLSQCQNPRAFKPRSPLPSPPRINTLISSQALLRNLRRRNRHRWFQRCWHALRSRRRRPRQCGPATRTSLSGACESRAPLDNLRGSLDARRDRSHPRNGRPKHPLAGRPHRLRRRQQTPSTRTTARWSERRRSLTLDFLPDGL